MSNQFSALRKLLWLLTLATFPLVAESGQAQVPCDQAAFTQTPVDTPVLPSSTATFFSAVNGPWPIQWYENGSPIAEATNASYTTEVITNGNNTNAYSVGIVGCSMSPTAHTLLFTPSATESVGIQFGGGGTNGAPVYMSPSDIAGVQEQAYWNPCTNSATNSGRTGDGMTLPDSLRDSSNNPSQISFTFSTFTNWSAGAPIDQPSGRLLSGIAGATNPDWQTMSFGHVPPGKHALIIYSLAPSLEPYYEMAFSVTNTTNIPTFYEAVSSANLYAQAPGFYTAASTNILGPSIGDVVRFNDLEPDDGGNVTLSFTLLAAVPGRHPIGINAIQLVLDAPDPGPAPVIVRQPQFTVAAISNQLQLAVVATGSNLTYQWRENDANLYNGGAYTGVNTATLTINPFTAANIGNYSVAVFNPAGSAISQQAAVAVTTYNITQDLAGYWPFDQTTGSNAPNAVAGGQPVEFIAPVKWGVGQVSNAVILDGQATIGYVPSYALASNAIAGAAWLNVNWDQFQAVDPGGSGISVFRNMQGLQPPGCGPCYVPGQFSVDLVFDSNTGLLQPAAVIDTYSSVAVVYSPVEISSNGWHHIAFSADGVQLKLYLDGTNVAVASYSGALVTPAQPWISVGGYLYTDTNNMPYPVNIDTETPFILPGSLDDMALWDRALTASEVSAIYQQGLKHLPLTSVVEYPPGTPATLTASASAGKLAISWTPSGGTLQSSPALGPQASWTTIGTTNPATASIGPGALFFRVINP